ncbi:MAG: 3-oxoacyl-[acyl-carrier-protein] synthase III C-terminal domain-containing protein [Sporolactobacillus sp.]
MRGVKIKDVAIYHPEHSRDNQFYIDHFDKQGKDIRHFMDYMGRKSRYIITDEEENGLTMGIAAAKKVLEKSQCSGQDLDIIVFSSQVPEYTFPSNAMILHREIQGGPHTLVYDNNANCAGMTVAIEQLSQYMQANPKVNRVLVVGSDYNTLLCDPQNEITYANYGDAACAVILESSDEEGFIDSEYFTDSINMEKIKYPQEGLSNALHGKSSGKYINWLPFDADMALPHIDDMLDTLLERNGLAASDVKAYCLSQFSLANVLHVKEHLHLTDRQVIYIGDRFGYTSTSSPFMALHEAIQTGVVKRGDYVLFWTIGCGYQLASMLYKY